MILPKWISFDFFEKVLKKNFHKNIVLLEYRSADAVPEGENYTSDLFRAKLVYLDNERKGKFTLSVIVKCANEEGGVKTDIAKNLGLFDKEVQMFTKIFPEMDNILGQKYTLSSKCYYGETRPHAILVFEDLTTEGFKMEPRHIGFDLAHCFKVIEKMAQMHAASVIMYDKNANVFDKFQEGLFAENEMIKDWLNASYSGLIDATSRWPGFEKYGNKLKLLGENGRLDRGFRACKRDKNGFNVLNHGDLWVNNMMFSYDENDTLQDMKFVDFQMNIFASPVIDLHYFIATSTKLEVKLNNIDAILDFYYAQLLTNLSKLEFSLENIPTRNQFLEDYNKRAFSGFMGAATVLAFVKASTRKDASFENIIKDCSLNGFRYHAYNNERFQKHMEVLLSYYDSLGIFD